MTYPYGERMKKLNPILKMDDKYKKKKALKEFRREERAYLESLTPPLTTSEPLILAENALALESNALFLPASALPALALSSSSLFSSSSSSSSSSPQSDKGTSCFFR